MKFTLLALLSLFAVSCASHQGEKREPSSVEKMDVERGVNTDSYGNQSFR